MQELMGKSNEGALTSGEEANWMVVSIRFASVMHSRARIALQRAGYECPRDARKL